MSGSSRIKGSTGQFGSHTDYKKESLLLTLGLNFHAPLLKTYGKTELYDIFGQNRYIYILNSLFLGEGLKLFILAIIKVWRSYIKLDVQHPIEKTETYGHWHYTQPFRPHVRAKPTQWLYHCLRQVTRSVLRSHFCRNSGPNTVH